MSAIQHDREEFWQQYYAGKIPGDSELVDQPSPFAKEVSGYLESGCSLLEIGCGNGRDSCFFALSGVVVVATDICEAAISLTGKDSRRKIAELWWRARKICLMTFMSIMHMPASSFTLSRKENNTICSCG